MWPIVLKQPPSDNTVKSNRIFAGIHSLVDLVVVRGDEAQSGRPGSTHPTSRVGRGASVRAGLFCVVCIRNYKDVHNSCRYAAHVARLHDLPIFRSFSVAFQRRFCTAIDRVGPYAKKHDCCKVHDAYLSWNSGRGGWQWNSCICYGLHYRRFLSLSACSQTTFD